MPKLTAASLIASAALLAAFPVVTQAYAVSSDDDLVTPQSTVDVQVHTVSTSGTPALAAMLNAGTAVSVLAKQNGGVEVAGVRTDATGAPMVVTVSTTGDGMHAALLNAGTAYSVLLMGQH